MHVCVCACEHLWVRGQSSRAPAADVQTAGGKSPPAKPPLTRKTAHQICKYIKINNRLKTLSKRLCSPERCSEPPHSPGGGGGGQMHTRTLNRSASFSRDNQAACGRSHSTRSSGKQGEAEESAADRLAVILSKMRKYGTL